MIGPHYQQSLSGKSGKSMISAIIMLTEQHHIIQDTSDDSTTDLCEESN